VWRGTSSSSCNGDERRCWFSTVSPAAARTAIEGVRGDEGGVNYQPPPWLDPNLDAKSRAEQFLSHPRVHPSAHNDVEALIRQLCKKQTLAGLQLATDVVERLVVEKRRYYEQHRVEDSAIGGKLVPIPIKTTWHSILYGWALLASKHRVAQIRMKEVLERVVEEAKWDRDKRVHLSEERSSKEEEDDRSNCDDRVFMRSFPTVDIYNTYMFGLANAANLSRSAAVRARDVLLEMSDNFGHFDQGQGDEWRIRTRPNTRSFMHAIMACRNSRHPESGALALDLLREMQAAHEREKIRYEQQFGTPYTVTDVSDNKRKIVTPDVAVYTAVMQAIINSRSNVHLVFDLLQELLDSQGDTGNREAHGTKLDVSVFVMAISAFSKMIQQERNEAKRVEYAQQAEEILRMAIAFYATKRNNNESASATTSAGSARDNAVGDEFNDFDEGTRKYNHDGSLLPAFNACLSAWSQAYSPEVPFQCERILRSMISGEYDAVEKMKDFDSSHNGVGVIPKPNVVSFNCCLFAWSRVANKFHDDAALKARELLSFQHELCESGVLFDEALHGRNLALPDYQSYTLAILAIANSTCKRTMNQNKAADARALLELMLTNVHTGRIHPSGNPTGPFSAVLSAVAKSPCVAASSTQFLERRRGEDSSVSEDMFSSVVETDNDPYSLALRTYQEVIDDEYKIAAKPDHHFFSAMIKVVERHCDERSAERDTMARSVFERAGEEGQVSSSVVQSLAATLGDDVVPHRLPRFWFRNVPSSYRFNVKRDPTRRRRRDS